MTIKDLEQTVRKVTDFPKRGILFYDITGTLANPEAFRYIIDTMIDLYKDKDIEAIVAVEARGFFIGAPFAYAMRLPFILVRKSGKLPGITLKGSYQLEYGRAEIEIHQDDIPVGKKVLLVDDIIATGETLATSAKLLEQGGSKVHEIFGVIGLSTLAYKNALKKYRVTTLLECKSQNTLEKGTL